MIILKKIKALSFGSEKKCLLKPSLSYFLLLHNSQLLTVFYSLSSALVGLSM